VSNLLALGSSLVWGVSDYVGGSITRAAPAQIVVLWSQAVGFFVAVAGALIIGGRLDPVSALWGAAAGVGGAVALVSFYHGLATGRMAVVAPIASLVGAGLPIGVGLALGERPPSTTLAGIAVAIPAIWLVSGGYAGEGGRAGVGLAVAAGVGFGVFFIFLGQTPEEVGLWPLIPARVASVATMTAVAVVTGVGFRIERSLYGGILVAGAGDMTANFLFLVAAQTGLLSVVSVLASLYPAVTVLLARLFGERVSRSQWIGVALAVVSVGLIAA
jgi:drug/metabolite transporter (DMT)-like permease